MIEERSELSADARDVWSWASSMTGVNEELMPWIRMTHPPEAESLARLAAAEREPGRPLFGSWLLLGGWIPIDRHQLVLEAVHPGLGFDERSHSWLQREWLHRRRIRPVEGGCEVVDEVEATPRIGLLAPVVEGVVRRLFRHRHRRLRRRFGASRTIPAAAAE